LRRGDINLTEMILKKVINVADHEDAAEAAKLLGDLAKEEIDLMRAKQYYIKAIRLQPENLEYIRASKGIAEKIGNVQDVKIYQGIENIVLMKNLKRLVEKHGSKPVSESLDLKDLDHNVNDLLSKIGDNDKPEEEKIDQYVDLISDIKKFCSNIRKSQENISEYLNNIEDLVKELNNKINKSITNKSIDGSFQ
jgi:tetratricopeptide (TPR) repeat protein